MQARAASLWRPWMEKRAAPQLARLDAVAQDQNAFAVEALRLIHDLEMGADGGEEKKNDEAAKLETPQPAKPDEEQPDSPEQQGQPETTGAEEQEAKAAKAAPGEETTGDEGEAPQESAASDRAAAQANPTTYRAFTTQFDEVVRCDGFVRRG